MREMNLHPSNQRRVPGRRLLELLRDRLDTERYNHSHNHHHPLQHSVVARREQNRFVFLLVSS